MDEKLTLNYVYSPLAFGKYKLLPLKPILH